MRINVLLSEFSITRTLTESTPHIMDSAEETELCQALSQQGILLGRQQEELEASHRAYL